MIFYYALSILLFLYLAFNVSYLFLFSIAGLLKRKNWYSAVELKRKIVVLIPTYKEDNIIINTALNAIHHDYPVDRFDIYIIADQLQETTVKALSDLPIHLVNVSFNKSTKAKSIKSALRELPDNYYDIAFILDADNVMGSGCLEKMNHAFDAGFDMVQLHRTAKNRNTPTAVLDAISEEINNHIFRKGHRIVGLSSALIGSGMGFRYTHFKNLMMQTDIDNNPGEDREIYLEFLRMGKTCEYIEDAFVYDEKVQSARVLEKQRTRWISAQLQYARRFWTRDFFKTFSFGVHYFDYALQTLLLPRLLLVVATMLIPVVFIFLYLVAGIKSFPSWGVWGGLSIVCWLGLFMSAYRSVSSHEILIALRGLPKAFWSFLRALLKSSSGNREFIHTPKEYVNTRLIMDNNRAEGKD